MTRQEFMARLGRGLTGAPVQTMVDILSDYESHFIEARAAGRDEAEVAAALGDPARLARELRAQVGLKRWDETRTPSAALGAVLAVVGLGALDILILAPLLIAFAATLASLLLTALVLFLVGLYILAAGPFAQPPGGPVTAVLIGLGLMGAAVFFGAVTGLASLGLIHVTVWYGRLHLRLLRPTPQRGEPPRAEELRA
jgi:uncharacterized membrane protein